MDSKIDHEYHKVLNYCQTHPVPEYMLKQSVAWEQGLWKTYRHLLDLAPFPLKGRVAVDFGCKYGHLLPLLVIMGVDQAIGIDVEDTYLDAGRMVFEKLYPRVRFLKSDQGYIPLQPETIDFVLVNEVISHINPGYLEIFYAEIARILKQEGVVLISDGNNLENPRCREKLVSLYGSWENGPDGSKTDRDTVTECYLTRRKNMVRARYPDLDLRRVDFLAKNTSGLFGDFLIRTIDDYVKTSDLIRRPYQRGICPTNPNSSGVVMERGLHPLQIKTSLESYGLKCKRVLLKPMSNRSGLKDIPRDILARFRYRIKSVLSLWFQKKKMEGFQLIGVKE
jgi:SAM-dependent methyltransferase